MTTLFPESGGADVLSVDIGWDATTEGRTAIAYRTFSGISVMPVPANRDLAAQIGNLASGKALVLLDIPIEGCAELDARSPFRQVDRALHRCGIPVLPSYKAAGRGALLRDELLARRPDLRVEESYPYAVLRVLWALKNARCGLDLGRDSYQRVSLSEVWWDWPPRHKGEPSLDARRSAAAEVAKLLCAHFPKAEAVRKLAAAVPAAESKGLATLSDQFDALLGLVAGLAAAAASPWSWRAAVGEERGAVLTISDQWLREQFRSAGSILDI